MKARPSLKSLIVALILLNGCVATGMKFVISEPAPNDKGLIYFYRPNIHAGSLVKIKLVDNGKQILRIQNGQFIKYIAEPGMHKFHTDTAAIDKPIEFNVEAGKTYYVRTGMRLGMWVGTWYLSRVFEGEALDELKTCCRTGKTQQELSIDRQQDEFEDY